MSIPQCIILEIPNDSIYDFDRVSLEIPVKNCIVGMLLTCLISKTPYCLLFHAYCNMKIISISSYSMSTHARLSICHTEYQ